MLPVWSQTVPYTISTLLHKNHPRQEPCTGFPAGVHFYEFCTFAPFRTAARFPLPAPWPRLIRPPAPAQRRRPEKLTAGPEFASPIAVQPIFSQPSCQISACAQPGVSSTGGHRSLDLVGFGGHIKAIPQPSSRRTGCRRSGLTTSCPAISGAEPWIGSYSPQLVAPRLDDGTIPIEPGDLARLVGKNITEHILGHNHVELGRVFGRSASPRCQRTSRCTRHPGIPSRAFAASARQRRLVSSTFALSTQVSFLRRLRPWAVSNPMRPIPFDLMRRVGHRIKRDGLAVFLPCLMLAEIDAADQLPHDDKIDALFRRSPVSAGLHRPAGARSWPAGCWRRAPMPARRPQKALLGPLLAGQGPPTSARRSRRAAHCPKPGTCPARFGAAGRRTCRSPRRPCRRGCR